MSLATLMPWGSPGVKGPGKTPLSLDSGCRRYRFANFGGNFAPVDATRVKLPSAQDAEVF
jgi:hypothetical protein